MRRNEETPVKKVGVWLTIVIMILTLISSVYGAYATITNNISSIKEEMKTYTDEKVDDNNSRLREVVDLKLEKIVEMMKEMKQDLKELKKK